MAAVTALALGFRLKLTAYEMAVLLLAIGMVLVAEMMNTAIEKAVDLVCPQYHPLAKIAKDAAAGAVLAAALIAAAVGYYLLFTKLV